MAGDASAYAALGLEPGADSSAIEQAYKRLIKQHHPDREGGDSGKAAEINHAYRELRIARNLRDPLELNDEWTLPRGGSRAWLGIALVLVLAIIVLLVVERPLAPLTDSLAPAHPARPANARPKLTAVSPDAMDAPLHLGAIDASVASALHLARTRDEMALASVSRDCHHLLRSAPTLVQLDRCAAFDDAVVELQDRDPLRDQGPFSELDVTGRVWSGATALSDDSVAIDARLDRIRMRVEVVLAPGAEVMPPAPLPRKD